MISWRILEKHPAEAEALVVIVGLIGTTEVVP
jgi:hypothetical protein